VVLVHSGGYGDHCLVGSLFFLPVMVLLVRPHYVSEVVWFIAAHWIWKSVG